MSHHSLLFRLLPVLLAAAGCTANPDTSIIVTAARAPGDKCDFSDPTLYVEGGSIDITAFGVNSSYFQVFSWENDLQQSNVVVNGDLISGPTVNTFIANRISLTYLLVSPTGSTTPAPGLINITASIAAGALPDKNSVGVEMLTPAMASSLAGSLVPGAPPLNLLVTFQLLGNVVGGAGASTNVMTFPLAVYAGFTPAGGTCPAGSLPVVTSCGIPGRDLPVCFP